MFAPRILQSSDAGTYMWYPVLTPHITGGAFVPGADTEKESTWHWPRLLDAPAPTAIMFVR